MWAALLAAACAVEAQPQMALTAALRAQRGDLAEVCCTSDSILTESVRQHGGIADRFSHWNGYDLSTKKGTDKVLADIRHKRYRYAWFSPPCGPDSAIQNCNQRTEEQREALQVKRVRSHRIQRNIKRIFLELAREGVTVPLVEQPGSCGSLRGELLPIREQFLTGKTHGCAWDMRDPKTGLLIKKSWHILSPSAKIAAFFNSRKCPNTKDNLVHEHKTIEGSLTSLSASYP